MDAHTSPDDSKHDAQTPEPVPPVIEAGVKREGDETATRPCDDEKGNRRRPRSTWADLWQVAIQGAVMLGALWALSIYKGQLVEMREANRLMKASADAATDAANSAKDSVKQAREASHLEQRAWVSTLQVPKSDIPQEGSRWRAEIPIKNTGKTFARKVGLDATVYIIGTDGKPNFTTRDPRSDPPVRDLLLSPNGEYAFAFHTKGPISHEDVERIKAGGNAILHGYITYYDIFDCVHWTIFCFWLDPEDWKWKVYREHNDADNDRCE